MTSNVHLQWTNGSAYCYDNTVLRTQAHGFESRYRGTAVCENAVGHIHDIHNQQHSTQ